MISRTEIVICGAGIAAAYHLLSVRQGMSDVFLVDARPPMSLTSDKSSEGYRNWWPGPDDAMVRLMNRSIDLLEEFAAEGDNRILLNRRGYLYVTADTARIDDFGLLAEEVARLGAGPVRYHTGQSGESPYLPAPPEGYLDQPIGSDLILDLNLIRQHFSYLAEDTIAVLHARRCGWFSGQQLGMFMLEQALKAGASLVEGRVEDVQVVGNRVAGVKITSGSASEVISTSRFVNAAGPFGGEIGNMLDLELPILSELHLKLNFNDPVHIVPRQAPMTIWADPQNLSWSAEERETWAEFEDTRWLLDRFPPAVHCRPDGGEDSPILLMLWPYHVDPKPPTFPIPVEPEFPEIVLRGMARMIPGLSHYIEQMPKPVVDGGYYMKTGENCIGQIHFTQMAHLFFGADIPE